MLSDKQKILFISNDILSTLNQFENIVKGKNLSAWQKRLYEKISGETRQFEEHTLWGIRNAITKLDPQKPASISKVVKNITALLKTHGRKVAPLAADIIYDVSESFYKKVKRTYSENFSYPYSFVAADEQAIERINTFQHIFIGEHYQDKVTKEVKSYILRTIEEGKGALSRDAVAKKLTEKMPGYVRQHGYFDVVAGQILNSSRSYSSMRFFEDAQIDEYEVSAVNDERTSAICTFMDGTVLSVSRTIKRYALYDQVRSIDEVKQVAPWLREESSNGESGIFLGNRRLLPSMNAAELQTMGVNAPPYHARCRTDVFPLFK